jgi:hypothetical protein
MKARAPDRAGGGSGHRARGPLVGRGTQLRELSSALAAAEAGRGALFLLSGEAGIGKTRLAEAVAEEAVDAGYTVLWGSAWEAGGAPAYWPWTQVIRELLHDRDADELVEDLGHGAPYVAKIAPDLVRLPTTIEPARSLDTEVARFTAFDATASFLVAAAARRPTVIVLDDLHAADVATVRLLEFLARSLHGARILAVATHQTGAARGERELTAALADLGRAGQRLTLGGLSRDEVLALASAQTAAALPPRLVDRLHALTEGNPLFVDEVMRLVAGQGALVEAFAAPAALGSARVPVPDAVRETIRRRLAPLEPAVVQALTAAAVIGPEFDLEALARVIGEERTTLLAHLGAAADAGLVEDLPATLGRYRFAHALMRETLYEDLTVQDRVVLHTAAGEAIAELHGTGADAPLSELAHHFLQAAPAGDADRAADFAVRAGARALEHMAYEQAIQLFGDALSALRLGAGGAAGRGSILLRLGQAEMRAGRLDAGRATLRKAAAEARGTGDAELLASAAVASAPWGLATATSDEEGLVPLLEEALARLPDDDSALRARLLARLAAAQYWSQPAARRGALVDEAIAMARRVGDAETLAFVLSDAHLATWDPDSSERSLPWAAEIYELAERLGNMELASIAHSWRISLLLELGDLAIVDREIESFALAASRLHQQRAQVQTLVHHCARAVIAGRFDDAERLLGEAGQDARLLEQDRLLAMRLGALAFVMREVQGRLGEIEPAVRQFAEAQRTMPAWRCALLCVHLQTGNDAELRRGYDSFASGGFAAELPRDNLWLPGIALLTEVCHHLGDGAGAGQLRTLLAPYSGRGVVTPDVAYIGPVDRYLAIAAATEGDHDAAAAWFASATGLARAMGAGPTCARLAVDEAEWLRERDPARAAALASEAASLAATMGLDRLVERARAVVPPARPARAAAPPARATAPAEPAEPAVNRLSRRGDFWELAAGGTTLHLKDAKGLHHLARLLEYPEREFHTLELVGSESADASAEAAIDAGLAVRRAGQGDAGPLLDARAKAEYGERIGHLREEIEEAEAFNDPERARRATAELEFVSRELSAAVGLGGRDRRSGAHTERARVNVTRALRGTIDRIATNDAGLGHHLRTCVRTGTFCVYEPGPDGPAWEIDSAG